MNASNLLIDHLQEHNASVSGDSLVGEVHTNSVNKKIKIAFIDDETSVLNAVKRVFYKENYEVFLTSNAFDLYELVKNGDIAVVISDQNMPHEKGNDVLNVVKQLSPKTTTILLTGYAEISSVVKAVNEGNIFRYLTKPWKEEELKRSVYLAAEQYELRRQNEELLRITSEQNEKLNEAKLSLEAKVEARTAEISKLNLKLQTSFMETVKIVGAIAELSGDVLAGHSKRVAKLSRGIAQELNLPERHQFQVQMAAYLHDVGKISTSSFENKPDEKREDHVLVGFNIVNMVPALKEAAMFIKHHHEVYDGSGFPSKLKGSEIPLGSRIIAVADAYDKSLHLMRGHESKTPQKLVDELKNLAGFRYDPNVVKAFIQYLNKEKLIHNNVQEKCINLYELQPGMILARPIHLQTGKLMVNMDIELTKDLIDRIFKRHMDEPVETEVFIYERKN